MEPYTIPMPLQIKMMYDRSLSTEAAGAQKRMVESLLPRRRGGRAAKAPGEDVRIQQTFRVSERIDEMIRESAERNCRSLSEELEFRIQQTFDGIVIDPRNTKLIDDITDLSAKSKREKSKEAEVQLENAMATRRYVDSVSLYPLVMMIAADLREYEENHGCTWREDLKKNSEHAAEEISEIIKERVMSEKRRYERILEWRNNHDRINAMMDEDLSDLDLK